MTIFICLLSLCAYRARSFGVQQLRAASSQPHGQVISRYQSSLPSVSKTAEPRRLQVSLSSAHGCRASDHLKEGKGARNLTGASWSIWFDKQKNCCPLATKDANGGRGWRLQLGITRALKDSGITYLQRTTPEAWYLTNAYQLLFLTPHTSSVRLRCNYETLNK